MVLFITVTGEATPAAPAGITMQPGELEALAYRLATERAEYVAFLERVYKLPREEAIASQGGRAERGQAEAGA